MGIPGLLKGLKVYTRQGSVRDFSGKTLVVDASSWLHKSVYSIAEHYVEAFERGAIDDRCVNRSSDYIFKRCQELLRFAEVARIFLVMDGKRCPLKAVTNQDREQRRRANLTEARSFKKEGRRFESQEKYKACIKIADNLTKSVMIRVERQCQQQGMNVLFTWAPYEADAQMVRICMDGAADAIVTEVRIFGVVCLLSFEANKPQVSLIAMFISNRTRMCWSISRLVMSRALFCSS
jgi:exonuclease 1